MIDHLTFNNSTYSWPTHKNSEHPLVPILSDQYFVYRPAGPSKSELKKRAKALEKEKKAAEKAAKQQEIAQQQAAADVVRCFLLIIRRPHLLFILNSGLRD